MRRSAPPVSAGREWLWTMIAPGFTARPPRAAASRSAPAAPGRPASASQTKLSRLPAGPGRPEEAKPSTSAPVSACTRPATETSAARRSAAERTTPPRPTRSRPTSNWGLTSAMQSKAGAAQPSTAGRTLVSEMNDTSATTRSGA